MRYIAGLVLLIAVVGVLWPRDAPVIDDRIVAARALAGDRPELDVALFGSSLARRADWPERIAGSRVPCGSGVIAMTVEGKPGAGSREGLALVEQSPPANHDIIILEYAINDADLFDGTSRGDSIANHRRMIALLREANPDVAIILMATNPVRGLQRLKRPRLSAYYRDYARLAEAVDVSFFDGTARWRIAGVDRQSLPDGLHPDPAREAELYQQDMLSMLARIVEPDCATLPG